MSNNTSTPLDSVNSFAVLTPDEVKKPRKSWADIADEVEDEDEEEDNDEKAEKELMEQVEALEKEVAEKEAAEKEEEELRAQVLVAEKKAAEKEARRIRIAELTKRLCVAKNKISGGNITEPTSSTCTPTTSGFIQVVPKKKKNPTKSESVKPTCKRCGEEVQIYNGKPNPNCSSCHNQNKSEFTEHCVIENCYNRQSYYFDCEGVMVANPTCSSCWKQRPSCSGCGYQVGFNPHTSEFNEICSECFQVSIH